MDEFDDYDEDMVYALIHSHFVFSTKNQEPLISEDMREGVWEAIRDIIREMEATVDCIGGTVDHVHCLVSPPVTVALDELIQSIKKGSAEWLRETYPIMKNFAWQEGYAGFSVGEEDMSRLAVYIDGQAKHHETISFQDEYRALLMENEIEFDEKGLFD
jgi:putative transposase